MSFLGCFFSPFCSCWSVFTFEHFMFLFFWFVVCVFFSLNCLKFVGYLFCLTGCAVFMWWLFGCFVGVTGKFLFLLVWVFFFSPLVPPLPPRVPAVWCKTDACHQFCTFNQSCSSLFYLSSPFFSCIFEKLILWRYKTLYFYRVNINHSKCCAQQDNLKESLCGRPLQADIGRYNVSMHANYLFWFLMHLFTCGEFRIILFGTC